MFDLETQGKRRGCWMLMYLGMLGERNGKRNVHLVRPDKYPG